jgi:hypothetical protein
MSTVTQNLLYNVLSEHYPSSIHSLDMFKFRIQSGCCLKEFIIKLKIVMTLLQMKTKMMIMKRTTMTTIVTQRTFFYISYDK